MTQTPTVDPARVEALGPAERLIQTLITWSDHMVHNRPGVVVTDPTAPVGVRWSPATWREEEDGTKRAFRLDRQGKRTVRTPLGVLGEDGQVREGGRVVAEYRKPGLFPEVATWMYARVAEVYGMDNELAARWASWAFPREHRDLKVVLAAFMLVQSRSGEPVREDGEVLFHDEDYRAVGEAMVLLRRRDGRDLHPKLLLRVGDVLALPGVAAINRELGFGRSARNPALGRYHKAVEKWLRHRERNPRMLEGLMRAGFRTTVMKLARKVGYKPDTPKFFEVLRWKQKQSPEGHRTLALDAEVAAAESWDGLTEAQICARIVEGRPSWKRMVGLLPAEPGLTPAIAAAAVESGALSDTDLVVLTPTLEDLGLLRVPVVVERWEAAVAAAESQRAAHIAQRVRSRDTAQTLQDGADRAVKAALEEVVRDLRVHVVVDKSGSMEGAIERAKAYLATFLQGFPIERTHVSIFNTRGSEVIVRHPSARGVEHAFRGHAAGGGTDYGAGVRALASHTPGPGEDLLVIFVGDQAHCSDDFAGAFRSTGLSPVGFGLLEVIGSWGWKGTAVEKTAEILGIPCFKVDEDMFSDAYAVPRVLRNLVASTPVGEATGARRQDLVSEILATPLLVKPVWA